MLLANIYCQQHNTGFKGFNLKFKVTNKNWAPYKQASVQGLGENDTAWHEMVSSLLLGEQNLWFLGPAWGGLVGPNCFLITEFSWKYGFLLLQTSTHNIPLIHSNISSPDRDMANYVFAIAFSQTFQVCSFWTCSAFKGFKSFTLLVLYVEIYSLADG